jgi:cytochrome c peroxidase
MNKKLLSAILLSAFFTLAPQLVYAEKSDYLRPKLTVPADNINNPARVTLGKNLFFDPRLSGSRWISCATCHNPGLGWADGLATGIGHGMGGLLRSSPTVINTAYNKFQFWDGRARTLEAQAVEPIKAAGEMARDMKELTIELESIAGYKKMFDKAYPPFDRWVAGDETAMSDAAKRGFEVFEGKGQCDLCHSGFNFQDDGFHNIGIQQDPPDAGRYNVRPVAILMGAFKTPTLREITRTSPYMHNGSYKTLLEVVDHYDRGGDTDKNLSPNIRPLGLTQSEKTDLVAFMVALVTEKPLAVTLPNLPQISPEYPQ